MSRNKYEINEFGVNVRAVNFMQIWPRWKERSFPRAIFRNILPFPPLLSPVGVVQVVREGERDAVRAKRIAPVPTTTAAAAFRLVL